MWNLVAEHGECVGRVGGDGGEKINTKDVRGPPGLSNLQLPFPHCGDLAIWSLQTQIRGHGGFLQ